MSEDSGIRELAGRYRLITPLGRRVMRGWDLHLRQVVAIRLFPPLDEDTQFVERAGVLTGLDHPGLVRVLDAGIAGDEPFLVQEFIAGTTLRARLADGPLTKEEVVQLGSTLAKALAYAHSQGVVHRDVQPATILLGPSQEPYLTDIGIAEISAPSYMAPEQANGEPATAASDVYSLGLVLLESLTGRTEYPGDDATTALARLSRTPKFPADLPHADTLQAMTSTKPEDRPDAATCVDLLRGSSAKSRVQTRTVLVAAVAAAVVATGVALVLNSPRPQQQVEPREASGEQQPQQTVTVHATATPTFAPVNTEPEISQTPQQETSEPQTPPDTAANNSAQDLGQPVGGHVDVPVVLIPTPPPTVVTNYPWYPPYTSPVSPNPPAPPDLPKHPKKPKKNQWED